MEHNSSQHWLQIRTTWGNFKKKCPDFATDKSESPGWGLSTDALKFLLYDSKMWLELRIADLV